MSPFMDCETPLALDALRGWELAADIRYVRAPEGLGVPPKESAPPPVGKAVYGTMLANHYETENFSINWDTGDGDEAIAAAAGEALEQAWQVLIRDLGWTQPVSSDTYLVWVVLDPSLGGTGYTTVYETDEFPEGYPVIYLSPNYFDYYDFFMALAQHEFHHALQFAHRDYFSGGADEAWYWEASANWAPYLVNPESTAFDYSAAWYADASALEYSSMTGSHQYGMFVLNGFLDEVLGPGTMQRAWVESESGADWLDVLEATTGFTDEMIWGQFAAAYGQGQLALSDRWAGVDRERAEQGTLGAADNLGSVYYRHGYSELRTVSLVMSDGEAVVSGSAGVGQSIEVDDGETFAVTATSRGGASWELVVQGLAGDTGAGHDDSGPQGADSAGDTAATIDDDGDLSPGDRDDPGGCGCRAAGPGLPPSVATLPLVLIAARMRRRELSMPRSTTRQGHHDLLAPR